MSVRCGMSVRAVTIPAWYSSPSVSRRRICTSSTAFGDMSIPIHSRPRLSAATHAVAHPQKGSSTTAQPFVHRLHAGALPAAVRAARAPATSTPAPTIRPAMMASAAFCRASPAKQRAGARPIRSPPMTSQRLWQRPASPGAPGAAWNRKRQQPTGALPTRRLPGCCSRVACVGRKRRRFAGRTFRPRRTAAGAVLIGFRPADVNHDAAADVRYLKNGCAAALRQLRDRITVQRRGLRLDGTAQVLGGINGQSIARRLTAAASAAGIEGRITGHSGRVGLAVELTRRGAPEQATAKAGGWKSSRMVAHYAAAVTAEQGAVATYL